MTIPTIISDTVGFYVINLKHRDDRREHMTKLLTGLGAPHSRIHFVEATNREMTTWAQAVGEITGDGSVAALDRFVSEEMRDKAFNMRRKPKFRSRSQAEVAVFFSHLRAWYAAGERLRGGERAIIFEDDVVATNMLGSKSTDKLYDHAVNEYCCPFIFLGYCYPRDNERRKPYAVDDNELFAKYLQCAHSYSINLSWIFMIKGYVEQCLRRGKPVIDCVVDDFIPRFLTDYYVSFYAFRKPLFNQSDSLGTDIQYGVDMGKAVNFGRKRSRRSRKRPLLLEEEDPHSQ